MTAPPPARVELRRVALYVGGLLGPFGGGITAAMLPELGGSFDVPVTTAGLALTLYFVPFAGLQLVSGTLGERWGRRRTTRIAYVVYALASVLCAVAPDAGTFFAGRVVQGAANAFTTPLLVAGLVEAVPAAALSRAVGVFGACQAAGQTLAPLVGALSTTITWRLAFVVVAAVAVLLALAPPAGAPRPATTAPRFADLVTVRMTLVSLAGFASYAGAAGLPFLVSLYAERRFAVSDAAVGFVIVGFGAAGIACAATWGTVSERWGGGRAAAAGLAGTAVLVALVGLTPAVGWLVAVWTAAGVLSSLATVGIQNVAAREVPGNRAGAVSVVSAFRFTGGAVAPLLLLPLYPATRHVGQAQGQPAFLVAGAIALAGAGCAAALTRRAPSR
ncbi:Predicted arabinose efflux permease, MFS family [Jatrophihabitans endophyticus]|uniref:Predicted arabinose efflux permease, MFS family n=1 Tax=Jatrophihabitans endophyticus TaxID=1206085 RepID=A0A1M5CTK8_9ACTN|nr:MFS transporter [Jatrophihabitans endophyticus]SHF58059.1 Predicted arabinose efflux permease, MFS family [Jatrophihabitans endophyticus]